jgi:hypothetical protein
MKGIAQCLAWNFVVFVVILVSAVFLEEKILPAWVSFSMMVAIRYFGIVQLLYVVPIWRYLRKTEYKQIAKVGSLQPV